MNIHGHEFFFIRNLSPEYLLPQPVSDQLPGQVSSCKHNGRKNKRGVSLICRGESENLSTDLQSQGGRSLLEGLVIMSTHTHVLLKNTDLLSQLFRCDCSCAMCMCSYVFSTALSPMLTISYNLFVASVMTVGKS